MTSVGESEVRRQNRAVVLEDATKAVLEDRNVDYGDPEDNFKHIAALWNAYLKQDGLFSAADVAALMILVKVARCTTSPTKTDHWTDIAGYAACGNGAAQSEAPTGAAATATEFARRVAKIQENNPDGSWLAGA